MVFSSIFFIFYFLSITLIFYFACPNKGKNLVLLLASLIFYSWGEPIYILLMLFSSIIDFFHAKIIYNNMGTLKAKLALISSISINLLLLGFFKYSDLFISSLNTLLGINIPLLNLGLPIGISFYTFQTMSYTIDVYRKNALPQNNIIPMATFVSLFPQLIAGPIVRYSSISNELTNRTHTMESFNYGCYRFLKGLCKKVLLANNIGIIWSIVKASDYLTISSLTAWLGIVCFSMQLYFDFSGYSDMAIGLGSLFGFSFPENFNYPYISKSISEFWSRWHISLGSWFRDYVYIPLGGNRTSKIRWIINIFIVWFLTGLWHGANWNFALWGIYFAIILIIEKTLLQKYLNGLPDIFKHLYVIVLILISWCIFEIPEIRDTLLYLKAMFFNFNNFVDNHFIYLLKENIILILIGVLSCTPITSKLITKSNIVLNLLLCVGLILSTGYLIDATYNPFLYFRF